ncbi:MAG: ACT domain-containing protein [Acidimicrobiia bacterium]|nr:ACT domain-containing protein [Acidimicrobiia bacterium]
MTEFTVHMANRPGQLAKLTRLLADAGIHIEALAAFANGELGIIRVVADDDTVTRRVLGDAGLDWDEHRVIATVVPNRPEALAELTASLADTGINIDAMYLLRTNHETQQFALAVNDPEMAREHLAV